MAVGFGESCGSRGGIELQGRWQWHRLAIDLGDKAQRAHHFSKPPAAVTAFGNSTALRRQPPYSESMQQPENRVEHAKRVLHKPSVRFSTKTRQVL